MSKQQESRRINIRNILSQARGNEEKKSILDTATVFAGSFSDTKWFKLGIVILFYAILYGLLKDIFIFFDMNSPLIIQMYLTWFFLILVLWAILPQKKSYL